MATSASSFCVPPLNLSKTKWLCVFPLLAEPSRTDLESTLIFTYLESTGVDRLGQGSRSHVTSSSCIRNHLCPFTVAKRVSQFRLLHVVANTGCCRCFRFYYNRVLNGISPHTPSDTHELEFFYAPMGANLGFLRLVCSSVLPFKNSMLCLPWPSWSLPQVLWTAVL